MADHRYHPGTIWATLPQHMQAPRSLTIQGWRGIPHSYAVVNQFQCLCLLKRSDVRLHHEDAPFASAAWKRGTRIFSVAQMQLLDAIPPLPPGEKADVLYRISYPYNISRSSAGRTVVFGTAEHQCVPVEYVCGRQSLRAACDSCDAVIVTPSQWSREGFLRSGAPADRVIVIPHGVDPSLFYLRAEAERAAHRQKLGWNGFVFLSMGAMNANKGMRHLLKAFAVVAQKHPHARLILKGLSELYPSFGLLQQDILQLTNAERAIIQPRLGYSEQTLSFEDMAGLYQAADAYVSPYTAEGFNLPVLEAMACGCPIICTRGGSTDDFVNDHVALRINATKATMPPGMYFGGYELQVDFDHLVHQMMTAVDSPERLTAARTHGPARIAEGFTWQQVTDRLCEVLFAP